MSDQPVSITKMNEVLENMTSSMKSGCYPDDSDSDATTIVPRTIVVTPPIAKRKQQEVTVISNNTKKAKIIMTTENELYGDDVDGLNMEEKIYAEFRKEDKGDHARRLRVPISSIEDVAGKNVLHPVFGFTKHWFDRDYIKKKHDQVIKRLEWWRTQNKVIYEDADEMYPKKMLDKFWNESMDETKLILDIIGEFSSIVIHALKREALASVIGKTHEDGIVDLIYCIIHSTSRLVHRLPVGNNV